VSTTTRTPTCSTSPPGDPGRAVDFDETPEGHAGRYGPGGELVGITLVDARRLLDENGAITITLPETISAAVLAPALARA
jgi:hypothetical protein